MWQIAFADLILFERKSVDDPDSINRFPLPGLQSLENVTCPFDSLINRDDNNKQTTRGNIFKALKCKVNYIFKLAR